MISKKTRIRIEKELKNWDKPNSKARKRHTMLEIKFSKIIAPLQKVVIDSECLTKDDFDIYINC